MNPGETGGWGRKEQRVGDLKGSELGKREK